MTVVQSCKQKPRPLKWYCDCWRRNLSSASLVVVMSNITSPFFQCFNDWRSRKTTWWWWFDLVQQAKTTQHLLIFTNQANGVIVQSMSYQTFVGRIWESIYHKLSPIYLRMKKCFAEILDDFENRYLPSSYRWVRLNVSERKIYAMAYLKS